jgi:ribosomal protein S18 acetylase RimI-like enzyme
VRQKGAVRIEPLPEPEVRPAAGILARAFRDNPLNRAVIGDSPEERLRSNDIGMRVHLPVARAHGRVLLARAEGRPAAVLVGVPPFGWPLPLPPFRQRLRLVFGQGWEVARRWAEVAAALQEHHWIGPHWYLATLGVEPALWGRGLGSRLLREWLRTVDADRSRAFLETDSHENVRFYERAGFRQLREVSVLGVPVYLMERAPVEEPAEKR